MNSFKNFSIKHKKRGWIKIVIGVAVLLLVLFILNFFVSPIKNSFYSFSSPIQKTFWTAGESSSTFFSSFFKAGSFAKENENLKSENQKLLAQIATLQSIEQANQAQSEVSASCQNNGFSVVMAGVIGLDENDILSINKGLVNGIAEGMPVINQQNVLLGKVYKVYKNFSQVMLITNKNSVVNVKIQQEIPADSSIVHDPANLEIDGVVKGEGGLNAYLDLIPVNSDINSQDVLVTSAIEKSFPKDLLVGKITQIEKNDQKPFQQAQISLFFDIKAIDNLFVITNYKR
jgi:rod shape-determining protein MreC